MNMISIKKLIIFIGEKITRDRQTEKFDKIEYVYVLVGLSFKR